MGRSLGGEAISMGRDSYYYYQYYYYYYGEDGEKKKKVHRKKRAQSRYYGSDRGEPEGVKPDTAA